MPRAHPSPQTDLFCWASLCVVFYLQDPPHAHPPISPRQQTQEVAVAGLRREKKALRFSMLSLLIKQAPASAGPDENHLLGLEFSYVPRRTMDGNEVASLKCVTSLGFNIKAGASMCTKLQRRETEKKF